MRVYMHSSCEAFWLFLIAHGERSVLLDDRVRQGAFGERELDGYGSLQRWQPWLSLMRAIGWFCAERRAAPSGLSSE